MHKVSANGAEIPAIGLGTVGLTGAAGQRLVTHALEVGYRHIDTAQMYGNEADIGAVMAANVLPRDQIFLTTKVLPSNYAADDFERSVDESLSKLKVDRVDLLLLHWPGSPVPIEDAILRLNRARAEGKARHIGISNFSTPLVRKAVAVSEAPLVCNQVEYHPYLAQKAVLPETRRNGLALVAYSPIAKGKVVGDAVLAEIGRRHGKSETQVTLRWLVQQDGVIAIPRTTNPERVKANLDVFDFTLSDDEMRRIGALDRGERLVNPAGMAPDWD